MRNNPRTQKMELSYIRTVVERAKELERQGKSIVRLELGEPDFKTPEPIIAATVKALRDGFTHYGPDEGIDELRELIAKKFNQEKGLVIDASENVIITAGASEAIFDAIMGLTGPDHSVLIPEPAFGNYYNCCVCAGSRPIKVPLKLTDKCQFDFEKLEEAVDSTTGFLVLNNPHNPTGGMFSASEIRKLAKFAIDKDIVVITDDIYEDIYYGDDKPLPIASLPGMQERTVMIGGFSKTYAMTGWRVGYVVAPTSLYESIQKIHQYVVTCVTTFSQIGIAEKLEQCDEYVQIMVKELNERRNYIIDELNKLNDVTFITPQGAFYFFINISKFGYSSMEFSRKLLEEKGLATVPGSAFGAAGEGFIRISYATSLEEIKKGMSILRSFLAGL